MIDGYATSGTSPTVNPTEPLSLADRIERTGRALNANELAELLAVSKVTVFKHAKAGRIPSFRVGTCVRFDPRAVARWLRRPESNFSSVKRQRKEIGDTRANASAKESLQ